MPVGSAIVREQFTHGLLQSARKAIEIANVQLSPPQFRQVPVKMKQSVFAGLIELSMEIRSGYRSKK
jgi:hypothetical protein